MTDKTLSDYLLKEIPELAISGLYKGLGFGVDVLSDYVTNPVENVAFDTATLGAGKGLKAISPLLMGLMNPSKQKGITSFFRGVKLDDPEYDLNKGITDMSRKEQLAKMIRGRSFVGGAAELEYNSIGTPINPNPYDNIPERFAKENRNITYASLFPNTAESYATVLRDGPGQRGLARGGKSTITEEDLMEAIQLDNRNNIGAVLKFNVPNKYLRDINKPAEKSIDRWKAFSKQFPENVLRYRKIIDEIPEQKAGFLEVQFNPNPPFKGIDEFGDMIFGPSESISMPNQDTLNSLLRRVRKNPKEFNIPQAKELDKFDKNIIEYAFTQGIPSRFLQNLEFVESVKMPGRYERLNQKERIQNILRYLRSIDN